MWVMEKKIIMETFVCFSSFVSKGEKIGVFILHIFTATVFLLYFPLIKKK